jgi:CRP-like cAMP-binding protein
VAFRGWNEQKLKIMCEMIKERVMDKGEVLFEDNTKAEMLFFLISGSLKIEKEVDISNEIFWPVKT